MFPGDFKVYSNSNKLLITINDDWPRPFRRVELGGYTYSRVDAVNTFSCADISFQSIVTDFRDMRRLVRGCGRWQLPEPFQFIRQRYRLTHSWLHDDKVREESITVITKWRKCRKNYCFSSQPQPNHSNMYLWSTYSTFRPLWIIVAIKETTGIHNMWQWHVIRLIDAA